MRTVLQLPPRLMGEGKEGRVERRIVEGEWKARGGVEDRLRVERKGGLGVEGSKE